MVVLEKSKITKVIFRTITNFESCKNGEIIFVVLQLWHGIKEGNKTMDWSHSAYVILNKYPDILNFSFCIYEYGMVRTGSNMFERLAIHLALSIIEHSMLFTSTGMGIS